MRHHDNSLCIQKQPGDQAHTPSFKSIGSELDSHHILEVEGRALARSDLGGLQDGHG